MLKSLCLTAALLVAPQVLAQQAGDPGIDPAAADTVQTRLWEVLEMASLMPILRDEALIEAEVMQDEMFDGASTGWLDTVRQIHEPARLEDLFLGGVDKALATQASGDLGPALDFYQTDLGRRLIGLESSARQAMLEPDTEAAARAEFAEAASREDPRVEQIARLIDEGDLIGPNVAGGLNAAVAFSKGFAEGGGFDMPLTEDQMLADAWAQEPSIRAETLGWMEAYLMLAYSPLNDAELERYIRFAGSDEGQALSAALFAGFDAMFLQTSWELGLAAAAQMQGRSL